MNIACARGGVEIKRIKHCVRDVTGQACQKIKSGPYDGANKVTYKQYCDHADDDSSSRSSVRPSQDGSSEFPKEAVHLVDAHAVKDHGHPHGEQSRQNLFAVFQVQTQKGFGNIPVFQGGSSKNIVLQRGYR